MKLLLAALLAALSIPASAGSGSVMFNGGGPQGIGDSASVSTLTVNGDGESGCLTIGSTFTVNCQNGLVKVASPSGAAKLVVSSGTFIIDGNASLPSISVSSNVGIGIALPKYSLDIGGGGALPLANLRLNDSNDDQRIDFSNASQRRFSVGQSGAALNFTGYNAVGQAFNFVPNAISNGTNSNVVFYNRPIFSDASNKYYGFVTNVTNTNSAANSAIADFRVGGASKLFVDVSGSVGIGTTAPCSTCTMHVNGGLSITGNVTFDKFSHVSAKTATAFVIPPGVHTIIHFNATDVDSRGEYNTTTDSGTFTATLAGRYLVTATVLTSVPALNTTIFTLGVSINGTEDPTWVRCTQNNLPTNSGCSLSTVVSLAAGDALRINAFHSDSGNLTLFADAVRNKMTVDRLP